MTQLTLDRENTKLTHFTLSPMSCTCSYAFRCVCMHTSWYTVYLCISWFFSGLYFPFIYLFVFSLSLIPFGLGESLPTIENYFDLSALLSRRDQPPKNQRAVYSAWTLNRFAIPYNCNPHTQTPNESSLVVSLPHSFTYFLQKRNFCFFSAILVKFFEIRYINSLSMTKYFLFI